MLYSQSNSQSASQPQHKPLFKINKAVWRIYMAMLAGKGRAWQEGRFLKIDTGLSTKIYLIDGARGTLREIA